MPPVRAVPKFAISPEPFSVESQRFRLFMAQLENVITPHVGASGLDKFFVLLKFLRGSAKKLVQSLDPVDCYYTVAIQLLRNNYERTDVVRQRLLARLGALTPVNSKDNVQDLKALVNEIQLVVQSLEG